MSHEALPCEDDAFPRDSITAAHFYIDQVYAQVGIGPLTGNLVIAAIGG